MSVCAVYVDVDVVCDVLVCAFSMHVRHACARIYVFGCSATAFLIRSFIKCAQRACSKEQLV